MSVPQVGARAQFWAWGCAGSAVTAVVSGNVLQPPDVERQQFSPFHAEVQPPVLPGARPWLVPLHSEYAQPWRANRDTASEERDTVQALLQLVWPLYNCLLMTSLLGRVFEGAV